MIDSHTGLSTRLDEGRHIESYGSQPMNAFHAFHSPAGGFLLIGMLQPHSPISGDVCTQQLLLYKLRSLGDPESAIEGAMDLHWEMHTKWNWELKGCSPAPPACVGSLLAWLEGPAEVAVLGLPTQQEVRRLQLPAQCGVVDLQWSADGRWDLPLHTLNMAMNKQGLLYQSKALCNEWTLASRLPINAPALLASLGDMSLAARLSLTQPETQTSGWHDIDLHGSNALHISACMLQMVM